MSERDSIWMIQVHAKGSKRGWSATCREWFFTRKAAKKYISQEIGQASLEANEYRAMKYQAVRP